MVDNAARRLHAYGNTPLTQGRFAMLLLLLMGLSFGAKASFQDGSYLLESCSESLRIQDGARGSDVRFELSSFCNGFLSGFVTSLRITKRLDHGERPICMPEAGIPNHQVARIFVKTLRDNPHLLHEPGAILLYGSLMQAFPCK